MLSTWAVSRRIMSRAIRLFGRGGKEAPIDSGTGDGVRGKPVSTSTAVGADPTGSRTSGHADTFKLAMGVGVNG